ncbi:protein SAWADEE HOMEODOMAIN-like protein 2-like isoform X1 [Gossypium australe]|uniref:Protein SAWADEE HOMEODOMAIN-like protein 2-like isoform X1 n=1 Tax=Gossypium australe TaxID=47621 RepID=A0A5B6X0A0_9ROSI|nr:protein SAWADEE HOMEODOMAIN-like protein 2-like isoform X1 [Gossypium australe]
MGRHPSSGGPAFRFTQTEVAEMETILQEHHNQMPVREILMSLADKFSESAERKGKIVVQFKQIWNWFQNRRYAIRAKSNKVPGKLNITSMPRDDSNPMRNVPQPVAAPVTPHMTAPMPASTVPGAGRNLSESYMEFEAKSSRDGAWYDVATFLAHRYLDAGDPVSFLVHCHCICRCKTENTTNCHLRKSIPKYFAIFLQEVQVRIAGFGPEEDEWVNIRKHVRQRSLPCEASECVAVLPGDLVLCFQEGKDQALYFDAHVLDAQRRRHDIRGCRCRFLVRYDHDQSEEIVPLRKVCRRPETDYRLQQLHAASNLSNDQHKTSTDQSTAPAPKIIGSSTEAMQKLQNPDQSRTATDSHFNVSVAAQTTNQESKISGIVTTDVTDPRISPVKNAMAAAATGIGPGQNVQEAKL